MKIRFFDPGKAYLKIKDEIDAEMQRVLASGDLILRNDVEIFEKKLAEYTGTKYAVGLNSGTDALILSLKAIGMKEGDEVITSGHTFWATAEAILHCGAKPIIADIKSEGTIDPNSIESLITEKTKAIIPVHIAGNVCNMESIMKLAKIYNLKVIEDSAQAIGATKLLGETACYSFYPAKILGAYGDAGAVVTNDENIYELIKKLRNHGGKPKSEMLGYNSRLDNLQAAILNVKFKYLDDVINRRKWIAKKYNNVFNILETREVYQDYIIFHYEKEKFKTFLEEQGIECLNDIYPFPKEYEKPKMIRGWEQFAFRIPCNENLTDEEVNYIVSKLNEFLKK